MFLSPFYKAVLAIFFILVLGLLFVLSENFFIIPLVMFASYLSTKHIRCQKCKKALFKDKMGKLRFSFEKTCDNCGQDLLKS